VEEGADSLTFYSSSGVAWPVSTTTLVRSIEIWQF